MVVWAMKEVSERFLSFSLGGEKFAMPLLKVREVIAPPAVTPIPQAPGFCLGFMNLRGEIITVLDLRRKFGIKGENGPELSVVICELGGVSVGLTVDQINQVLSPRSDEVAPKPEGAGGKFSESITGVFRDGQSLVLFLDLESALNDVSLRALASGSAA
jgi:purine-binding chemotaxis protein CheW